MDESQELRYSRHLLLPDFSADRQQKLLDATVLIIGAGGLGCPAAIYLASAGTGRMVIVDHDTVDLSNLQRQIGHATDDIGTPKTESLARTLAALNPATGMECHTQRLDEELAEQLIPAADVVLDCSDNFATRFLINRICVQHRVPLVSGSAIRYEGQVAVFDFGRDDSACYRCLYNEDGVEETACSETGILAPVTGIIGSIQALETIKLLTGTGKTLHNRLLVFDGHQQRWREMNISPDERCPVCAGQA